MPIYYSIFAGHGRSILADELGAEDPFGLDPRVIVDRVAAAGYMPLVERPSPTPWPATGTGFETRDADGRTYLVTIGRDAEAITVQEVKAAGDRYDGA